MSDLERLRKAKEEADKGGPYLKFKDGDEHLCVIVGDPVARETVYINGRTYDYDPNDPDHAGVRVSTKAKYNVYVIGEGMKIGEFSLQTFGKIDACAKEYETTEGANDGLVGNVYKIKREGSDTKTVYHVMFKRAATDEENAAIARAELWDLHPAGGNTASAPADKPEAWLGELKAALQKRSGEDVKAFLDNFGISKVKDLPEDSVDDAFEFIKTLDGGDAVDPFAD